jgi:hypothetical protein
MQVMMERPMTGILFIGNKMLYKSEGKFKITRNLMGISSHTDTNQAGLKPG